MVADESHGALPPLTVSRLAAAQRRVPQTGIPPPAVKARLYQQLWREGRNHTEGVAGTNDPNHVTPFQSWPPAAPA